MRFAKKFFQDFGLRILALSLALVVWFYVHGDRPQPIYEVTQTIEDVLVEWELDPNYVVTGITSDRVSVTVRGPQSIMAYFSAADIRVSLDAAGLEEGSHVIPLHVDLPSNVRLISMSPNPMEIVLDLWTSKTMAVSLELTEPLPADILLQEAIIQPFEVVIDGAATYVDSVTKVVAPYSYEQLGAQVEDLNLVARDSAGRAVPQVNIQHSVSITLRLLHRKTVAVEIPNREEVLLEEAIASISFEPQEIIILGSKPAVDQLQGVLTEPLPLEEILAVYEEDATREDREEGEEPLSMTLTLTLRLPSGIELLDRDRREINVTILFNP